MRPILFIVGDAPVYSYGFFLGLAFVVGVLLAAWRTHAEGDSLERTLAVAALAVVTSLVGARVAQVVATRPAELLAHPLATLLSRDAGYAFLGGVVLAFGSTVVATRALGLDFWRVADRFIPAVALGLLPTRLGCHLGGCCRGVPAAGLGWPEALATTPVTSPGAVPLVPAPLLEGLAGLAIFLFLWFRVLPRRRFAGEAVAWFFALYSPVRAALETIRDDERGGAAGLTSAQLTLVVPFAISILFLVFFSVMGRARQPTPPG